MWISTREEELQFWGTRMEAVFHEKGGSSLWNATGDAVWGRLSQLFGDHPTDGGNRLKHMRGAGAKGGDVAGKRANVDPPFSQEQSAFLKTALMAGITAFGEPLTSA